MANKSKRTKRHAALAGIPQRIIDLSPREWPDARRAAWCRAYLAGAKSPHLAGPPRDMRDHHAAFRQGQRSADSLASELAQVAETRRIAAERREAYEAQRERALMRDRMSILGRLDGIDRALGGRDQEMEQIAGLATGALGMAAAMSGATLRRR